MKLSFDLDRGFPNIRQAKQIFEGSLHIVPGLGDWQISWPQVLRSVSAQYRKFPFKVDAGIANKCESPPMAPKEEIDIALLAPHILRSPVICRGALNLNFILMES